MATKKPLSSYGPKQFAARIGLAEWQMERALRLDLIPPADPHTGRWPAAVVDDADARREALRADVGEIGRRTRPQGPPPIRGDYKGHPLYCGWTLERLADRRAILRASRAGRLHTRDGVADVPDPRGHHQVQPLPAHRRPPVPPSRPRPPPPPAAHRLDRSPRHPARPTLPPRPAPHPQGLRPRLRPRLRPLHLLHLSKCSGLSSPPDAPALRPPLAERARPGSLLGTSSTRTSSERKAGGTLRPTSPDTWRGCRGEVVGVAEPLDHARQEPSRRRLGARCRAS